MNRPALAADARGFAGAIARRERNAFWAASFQWVSEGYAEVSCFR